MTTATREGPIPFTGEMVRAILEGRKTQTRRVARSRRKSASLLDGSWADSFVLDPGNRDWLVAECPYGDAGDRLWVRETWSTHRSYDHLPPRDVPQDAPIWYAELGDGGVCAGRSRPGMFMVRWMSRLTLEVTSVHVERVELITEENAIAEGVRRHGDYWCGAQHATKGTPKCHPTATDAFRDLWDSINAKRGHGWDTNPWVWVVEFEVVTP